jgi:nucleoside-diphosphate-sugar epimerase
MRAFVTGGSGFLGSNLIAALRARGDEVRALARSDAAADAVRRAGAEPVRGELDDEAALRDGMAGCEVVFHVAALAALWGPYEQFYRVNVAGTEHALAAARAAGVRRFVYVSSESVLLDGKPIVDADETRPRAAKPVGFYPQTKALAEERVLAANSPELATVIVRPRTIWGRGDSTVLPQLARAVRSGKFRWIDGGRHRISTTHVANACEGLILAAERGRPGEIYFVTDGAPIEVRRFITEQLQTQGLTPGEASIPRRAALLAATLLETAWRVLRLKGTPPVTRTTVLLVGQDVVVNDAKARRELGYTGATTREAGLAAMREPRGGGAG